MENLNGCYIVANYNTYNILIKKGYKMVGRSYTTYPLDFDFFIIGNGIRTSDRKENTFYANATVVGGYKKLAIEDIK